MTRWKYPLRTRTSLQHLPGKAVLALLPPGSRKAALASAKFFCPEVTYWLLFLPVLPGVAALNIQGACEAFKYGPDLNFLLYEGLGRGGGKTSEVKK